MTSQIFLFLDTNVLLQCKALAEIDWRSCRDLAEFDEIQLIQLIVCLPVVEEIDKLKDRGNDRLGRRARKANGMIRNLVLSDSGQHIIRRSAPSVVLKEETSIQPTPDLLDYATSDNRILGCVHAYCNTHPDCDVRFLTGDTGPMATAKNKAIPFLPVPASWLSEPQPSAAERRIAELEMDNKRLRRTEPQVDIRFLSSLGASIKRTEGECLVARSLTSREVAKQCSTLSDTRLT